MKINNIIVTMWFNRYNGIKNIYEVFNQKLNEYFPVFNMSNLPANFDPIIPRINAKSGSGHSTLNMSNINLQLITEYDDKFNENFDSCIEYIKTRAKKIYNILIENDIKILYSAVLVNLNKEAENPINDIENNLLNLNINNTNISELGMRVSVKLEDKFYKIITVNNRKDFSMQKQIAPGQFEIIMPLISLCDAKMEKEYISINYELNDKYSFDKEKEYLCSNETFDRMFQVVENDIKINIDDFLTNGVIN